MVFLKQSLAAIALLILPAADVAAAQFSTDKNLSWQSRRDLASADYTRTYWEFKRDNLMPVDIDVRTVGGERKYSTVWRRAPSNRKWAMVRGMSNADFKSRNDQYRANGYRLLEMESYRGSNSQLYAAIWLENNENLGWSANWGMTRDSYQTYRTQQKNRGRRMVDIEAYETSSGIRYAAVFVSNPTNIRWSNIRNVERPEFQAKVTEMSNQGYRMIDVESWTVGTSVRYAAIWEKTSERSTVVKTNRSRQSFNNLRRQYADLGYRLVDQEVNQTPSGTRYAGIWAENNLARSRYSRRGDLHDAIEDYHASNNLPGISVAIIRNGSVIYRRGIGWADMENQKVAHSGTVYLAASVSKAIGATIAAKLEAEGRIDLNTRTRAVLANLRIGGRNLWMPGGHTHTIAQLLGHYGCIHHYSSGPDPADSFYSDAKSPSSQLWATNLMLSPCTQGTTWSYSTHGYTFVQAALEELTGVRTHILLRDELAAPHGLKMRVQFAGPRMTNDYERAVPYGANTAQNTITGPIAYDDSSWKIYGGGIETTALDLARFGWKTLNGEIVPSSGSDPLNNRLWRVFPAPASAPNSAWNQGMGWRLRNVTAGGASRRIAYHEGSWAGARARLAIYRDDGLVIAVMSNRRRHGADDMDDLTLELADIVLQ